MKQMETLSARALAAPQSGIVELVNYARGRKGLIPLWAGEGDLPTPEFVNKATKDALDAGAVTAGGTAKLSGVSGIKLASIRGGAVARRRRTGRSTTISGGLRRPMARCHRG